MHGVLCGALSWAPMFTGLFQPESFQLLAPESPQEGNRPSLELTGCKSFANYAWHCMRCLPSWVRGNIPPPATRHRFGSSRDQATSSLVAGPLSNVCQGHENLLHLRISVHLPPAPCCDEALGLESGAMEGWWAASDFTQSALVSTSHPRDSP